jgi:pimeloyl-ACP methyl ester carboxylesterase
MVTSPNSYWLSFFLKRGINVLCWNYRDYGLSQSKLFGSINPYNCKLDAEKVLDFLVNTMKIRGKIGVYGRSLGGIASTHLANRFPQYVKALIADRTFNELDLLSERRIIGSCTKFLFKLFSFNWRALNDLNFIEASCYKIVTCDPLDEVVENFSALSVGVAMKYAVNQFTEPKWTQFYGNLWLLHQLEDMLYMQLMDEDRANLEERLSS